MLVTGVNRLGCFEGSSTISPSSLFPNNPPDNGFESLLALGYPKSDPAFPLGKVAAGLAPVAAEKREGGALSSDLTGFPPKREFC